MATIDSTPGSVIGLSECARYGVSLADIGSGTITKKLAYRLKETGGNYLTKWRGFTPRASGFTEYIDFNRIAKSIVFTTPPDLEGWPTNASFADNNMHSGIELETKTIEIENDPDADPPLCEQTETPGPTSASTIVINSSPQYFQSLADYITRPLSMRAKYYDIAPTASQWVWIYGAANVRISSLLNDGSIGQIFEFTTAGTVTVIPIGPYNSDFVDMHTICKVRVENLNVGVDHPLRLICEYKVNDCNHCYDNEQELYFLSPLGGYDTMTFQCPEVQFIKQYQEVCRYKNCGATELEKLQRGGNTIANPRNRSQFTLVREGPNTRENQLWYESFLASMAYYKKETVGLLSPAEKAVKVLIEQGAVGITKDNTLQMVITGRYLDWETQGVQL